MVDLKSNNKEEFLSALHTFIIQRLRDIEDEKKYSSHSEYHIGYQQALRDIMNVIEFHQQTTIAYTCPLCQEGELTRGMLGNHWSGHRREAMYLTSEAIESCFIKKEIHDYT